MAGALRAIEKLEWKEKEDFCSKLQVLLQDRLDKQRTANHVLIRSRKEDVGYREVGDYVWVVGYKHQEMFGEVYWLTADYQVYSDSVESFDVDPVWLRDRFKTAST